MSEKQSTESPQKTRQLSQCVNAQGQQIEGVYENAEDEQTLFYVQLPDWITNLKQEDWWNYIYVASCRGLNLGLRVLSEIRKEDKLIHSITGKYYLPFPLPFKPESLGIFYTALKELETREVRNEIDAILAGKSKKALPELYGAEISATLVPVAESNEEEIALSPTNVLGIFEGKTQRGERYFMEIPDWICELAADDPNIIAIALTVARNHLGKKERNIRNSELNYIKDCWYWRRPKKEVTLKKTGILFSKLDEGDDSLVTEMKENLRIEENYSIPEEESGLELIREMEGIYKIKKEVKDDYGEEMLKRVYYYLELPLWLQAIESDRWILEYLLDIFYSVRDSELNLFSIAKMLVKRRGKRYMIFSGANQVLGLDKLRKDMKNYEKSKFRRGLDGKMKKK